MQRRQPLRLGFFSGAILLTVATQGRDAHPKFKQPTPSLGCSANTPPIQRPGEVVEHTLQVADPAANPVAPHHVTRKFRMLLPLGYRTTDPIPLIFDFHGYSSNSARQSGQYGSGFRQLAHEKLFAVVWPDGSDDSPSRLQGWNSVGTSSGVGPHGATCHPDRRAWGEYECYTSCGVKCAPLPPDNLTHTCLCSSCMDDVGFATALLDWTERHACVDLDRVHLSGASNGAMMTYQLAHTLSTRVASIVPVVGQPLLGFLDSAVPSVPVAVMHISGIFDGVIPANVSNGFRGQSGPEGTSWSSDGFFYHTVDQVLARYSKVNGCEGSEGWREYPTEKDGDMWWHCAEPFGGCHSGAAAVRCSSLGGHSWPTFTRAVCEVEDCPHVDFALLAWGFFEKHPRTAAALSKRAASKHLNVSHLENNS